MRRRAFFERRLVSYDSAARFAESLDRFIAFRQAVILWSVLLINEICSMAKLGDNSGRVPGCRSCLRRSIQTWYSTETFRSTSLFLSAFICANPRPVFTKSDNACPADAPSDRLLCTGKPPRIASDSKADRLPGSARADADPLQLVIVRPLDEYYLTRSEHSPGRSAVQA